ncbi:MAG: sigma-70 family RNA polymerase sigma factor [Planctomycetota bacterium]|nr:MAG: sigma-70 family RNA polymerase sigma factor [Planctomycetota bacterium]
MGRSGMMVGVGGSSMASAPLVDHQVPTIASHEEAFREVLAHWAMLNAYLRAIVRNPQLFEDTLSDVALAIARSWPTYDKARPFGPWARAIARRVALENLSRNGIKQVLLGPGALEALGAELEALGDPAGVEARLRALRQCTEKLSEGSQELVRLRYFENRNYKEIAESVRWTVDALYVAFNRIHKALSECVQRRMEVSQG